MKLAAGTRIGPYEIQSSLGAGGMGEVYKAADTELDRVVAIKVLPDQFVSNAERVARFERECTALASVNHPNVAQVYGIARTDDGRRALVMEFVDGDDLAVRIGRGRLTLDETLHVAHQIAAALEAAHVVGIVHRDLKPANIKVRSDDVVKVLDFGLARIADTAEAFSDVAHSPTITARLTEPGVVFGTASYMSPEQARGLSVDRRSDMWSFGCLLFEMLSGYRAFTGTTVAETMAAVLHATPDWTLLPDTTPVSLRRLVRRCLVRERSQRLDSASVARLEIEAASSSPVDEPVDTHRRRSWPLVFAAAAVAMAIGAGAVWFLRPSPGIRELRLDVATPARADAYSFALSPDGERIAFVAGSASGPLQLWLRTFAESAATPLPDTEGALNPFWSPDARSLGFFAEGKLKRISVAGGAAVTLADAPAGRSGSWSVNGDILFTKSASGPIYLVSAAGSAVRTVTSLAPGDGSHVSPNWHPDGRRFLFHLQIGDPAKRGLYLATIDSPDRARLLTSDGAAEFRGPNEIMYVREGTLYAQRFADGSNTVTGVPAAVASPVPSAVGRSAFSISRAGPVAYRAGRTTGSQLRWFGRNGEDAGAFAAPDAEGLNGPVLAPSGQRVAVFRRAGDNIDVWIVNRAGGALTRLTTNAAQDLFPVWTPDEDSILFRSSRRGTFDLYRARLDGEGSDALVLGAAALNVQQISPGNISRDGRWLLLHTTPPQGDSRDVWVHRLDESVEPRRLVATAADETSPRFSPDGRWFMYQTNESGHFEIAVRGFPSGQRESQVSAGGGVHGRWSPNGRELFYVAPNGKLMAVQVSTAGPVFRTSPPVEVFAPRFAESPALNPFNPQYDVAADGRFLINVAVDDLASVPITLLLNWRSNN